MVHPGRRPTENDARTIDLEEIAPEDVSPPSPGHRRKISDVEQTTLMAGDVHYPQTWRRVADLTFRDNTFPFRMSTLAVFCLLRLAMW